MMAVPPAGVAMTRDWEQQFRDWGKAPGDREQTKMENTESQIRAAITASTNLAGHPTRTAAQGSYYNLTHVPRESDVDIRVVLKNVFFMDWSFVDKMGNTDAAVRASLYERFGISAATYQFNEFRDDVGAALVTRFGPAPAVEPGDKAFNIRETRYHVDTDVIATLEHRRYHTDGTWDEGVEFRTRAGKEIINWPEQQNRNGIDKNGRTGERQAFDQERRDRPGCHDSLVVHLDPQVLERPDHSLARATSIAT